MHLVLGAVHVLLAAQATLVGTIRDSHTAQPLPGVVVTLTDLDRAAATDSAGRYTLRDVPAGPQHLSVRYLGYAPRLLHAFVPREGSLGIDVALDPEPLRLEPIDVRAPVSVRGLEGSGSHALADRAISMAAVRSDPMLAEPDGFEALGGGSVALRPESPDGVHILGGASDQTAYSLDGIPVFSPFHAAGMSGAWNTDALSRVELHSWSPASQAPHALCGTIDAETRAPGTHVAGQATASTTHSRVTLDGPLGGSGAGFVMSLRSGYPGFLAPPDEPAHLGGETGDWLGKIEAPLLGGRARLLGYGQENEMDAAAIAEPDSLPRPAARNLFAWSGRSLGAEWSRAFSRRTVRLRGWSARGDASSEWTAPSARLEMASARRDEGLLAALEFVSERSFATAGARVEWIGTSYGVRAASSPASLWDVSARAPVATLFAQHRSPIAPRVDLDLSAALAATRGKLYPEPGAQLRWALSQRWAVSGSYARTHQFAQTLRNTESVVGNVFPAELYVVAGAFGVPVARGDQAVIAVDCRPSGGLRLGLQTYARRAEGVVLVAPRDAEPFSTGPFAVGSTEARGLSLDAALSTTRVGFLASYGLQDVRLEHGDSSYVPEHGAAHRAEAGVIVFPSATASIQLGATAMLGRRATPVIGAFEWESHNLLNRGTDFGGSPSVDGSALGGAAVPGYVRLDLGFRKHWHVHMAGRNTTVALFGTVTNLLGRRNLLTYATDPVTGARSAVEMRPRAPLVVGLDTRF